MAHLANVNISGYHAEEIEGAIRWTPASTPVVPRPYLFWSNGTAWREANLWLSQRAPEVDRKTLISNASSLKAYASWLELENMDWWFFPLQKKNRCLWRYRGALVRARDNGEIATTTAAQRIRVLVAFYRWLLEAQLFDPGRPLWRDRHVEIVLSDTEGFSRTVHARSTDLAIPNRRAKGEQLEDGVMPVSAKVRNEILSFAKKHASSELYLMLLLGFFTGLRLGTICDLKVQTVLGATPDPHASGIYRLSVGPQARPPISTKHQVNGYVAIGEHLLELLRNYAGSTTRLRREASAPTEKKDLLFLTRRANGYAERGLDRSPAINVELFRLRQKARSSSTSCMEHFRFHQTRATFATQAAATAMSSLGPVAAIGFVRELLLHRYESTTLRYIRFVEKYPIKESLSNEFTESFMGLISSEHAA